MSPSGTFSGRWHEIFFQVLLGFQMKIWGEKKKKISQTVSIQVKILFLSTILQGIVARSTV